jgi:hypothetical protein
VYFRPGVAVDPDEEPLVVSSRLRKRASSVASPARVRARIVVFVRMLALRLCSSTGFAAHVVRLQRSEGVAFVSWYFLVSLDDFLHSRQASVPLVMKLGSVAFSPHVKIVVVVIVIVVPGSALLLIATGSVVGVVVVERAF